MKLSKIIKELKAPKNQLNKFGNYKYRSCEDILEAVKPLLEESTLNLSDDIVNVGNRYYVKSTATFNDGKEYQSTALAREPEEKKGMDSSQITGTASSYARKYALNGLFCIDDTKDADTDEHHKQTNKGMPEQNLPTEDINGEPIDKEEAKISYRNSLGTLGIIPTKEDLLKFIQYDVLGERKEEDGSITFINDNPISKKDKWSTYEITEFRKKAIKRLGELK